jgi:hypothetical protein
MPPNLRWSSDGSRIEPTRSRWDCRNPVSASRATSWGALGQTMTGGASRRRRVPRDRAAVKTRHGAGRSRVFPIATTASLPCSFDFGRTLLIAALCGGA